MAKTSKSTEKKKTKAGGYRRIMAALEEGGRMDLARVGELIEAFEQHMPVEEVAKYLVDKIRDPESTSKEKLMCMSFYLNAKKFHEKNEPEIDDEDVQQLTQEQRGALLVNYFDVPTKHWYKHGRSEFKEIAGTS